MKRRVTKAVFPVAGLGTRFLPATKSIPKEIMTLVDRPLIQYAIDEARAAGIKEFIFVTSRGKGALEDYFDINPTLEVALRKAGKDDLLEMLKDTNMESGAIAYIRQHKALGLRGSPQIVVDVQSEPMHMYRCDSNQLDRTDNRQNIGGVARRRVPDRPNVARRCSSSRR